MDFRSASRFATKPAFWRGFGSGLRSSLSSPRNRGRFGSSFRIALYSSVAGSIVVLRWVEHSRATSDRPLSTAEELGVSLIGGLGAVGFVLLCRRVWRRWNGAPAA